MNGIILYWKPDIIPSKFRRPDFIINNPIFPFKVEIQLNVIRRSIEGDA